MKYSKLWTVSRQCLLVIGNNGFFYHTFAVSCPSSPQNFLPISIAVLLRIWNAYLGMIGEIKTTIYFLWMTASVLVACLGEKDKIRWSKWFISCSGKQIFRDVEYSGTFFVNTESDDDIIGIVFGYQSPKKFFVASWKQKRQIYWDTRPIRATAESAVNIKASDCGIPVVVPNLK